MNASLFLLSIASLTAAPQDVLYDFYGPSCSYCKMMTPVVERLRAEGFPVQPVDADQYRDFAARFSIQSYPTFVLVIGGREQQRLVGWQDEATLRGLLAQIPTRRQAPAQVAESSPPPRPRRSLPVRLADDDSQGSKWGFHLPLPSFSGKKQADEVVQIDPPSPPASNRARGTGDVAEMQHALADATSTGAAAGENRADDRRPRGERIEEAPVGDDRAGEARSSAEPDVAKMLSSSVRIRVKDSNGVYFGSGVVIDSAPGKTLVLTCGHILRDAKQDSRIEVDVFNGKRSRTYRGSIVKSDLDADVGLISVATSAAVAVSPVASVDDAVRPRDAVVSIGCSEGELPSVEQLRVTMLNRYLGPDTIECTGVPGQGRSGGGLFTTRGRVVGVCTNADPRERKGVYAGLKPIHDLLRSAGLDDLIPAEPRSHRESLAEASAVKTEPLATDEPRHTRIERDKVERDAEATPPSRVKRAPAETGESLARQEASAGELSQKTLEQSEVICIIRPVNQPRGSSRVVIINRASRKFMAYLTGEMKDQLVPAMGHSARDERSNVSSTADGARSADPVAPEASDSSRTTAAWKPSASAR
jgi:S1-C subfamily serine protease